ncbi:MAG: hypothetical protein IKL08_05985 [Clostridia bacterium]|nr:hypothetical protein [Clostridia bacterium]
MKNPFQKVKMPTNILTPTTMEQEKPLIFIPNDRSYVQLLDYKIEGFKDFESFCEYLKHVRDLERENESLKNKLKELQFDLDDFIKELELKIQESMLDKDAYEGFTYVSIQERIYQGVLDRVKEIGNEDTQNN